MGFATFVLVSGFLSDRLEGGVLTATEKTSVLKLQAETEEGGAGRGHAPHNFLKKKFYKDEKKKKQF